MVSKRIFDFAASLAGLIVLSPVFLLTGIFILILMPGGSVLFRQTRVGRYGKLFTLVKFVTMKPAHGGNSITIAGESRITPLGRVLRKYKIDELPSLWNVLKGEMSLVGPRPDVPGYADKLTGSDRRILQLRPGLTGPATLKYADEEELLSYQPDPVAYNDEILFPDKVRINLNYIENQSFLLDLKIIFFTLAGKKLREPWAQ